MSLTKNQVFTLNSLTRDQSFSLVEPLKFNVRTRRNRPSVEREFKSAQFMHLSRDNKGNLCVSYSIGPMSSSMSGEEFFKKTKIKILEAETIEDDFSDLVPKKGEISKIQRLGEYKTEYYQGGFPSHSDLVFNCTEKQTRKTESLAKRLKTRKQIIPILKAIKSIFGTNSYSSPFYLVMEKAKQLGITEKEINSIESYTENNQVHHNLSIV